MIMDYKEKYEMALEGIQEILSSGENSIKMSRLQLRLQGIFPELKKSEDEDEAVLDALIRTLEGEEDIYVAPYLAVKCLKSLKDRVQSQPKQEWSVEDRSKIQRICKYLNEVKKYCADITEVRECIEWLKALIPQNT